MLCGRLSGEGSDDGTDSDFLCRGAAPRFYQALCALMTILRAPENLISLRSTPGLQYGIGGRPGVAALYSRNPATGPGEEHWSWQSGSRVVPRLRPLHGKQGVPESG